jgi:hypothetical protein
MGKMLGKGPFGSPVRLSRENMKLALQEIDCYVGRLMKPAQDRVQAVLHLQVLLPENFQLQPLKAVRKSSTAISLNVN